MKNAFILILVILSILTHISNSFADSDSQSQTNTLDTSCSGQQVQQCRLNCAQSCWKSDSSLPSMDNCVNKCWGDCNMKYCGIQYK